MRAKLLGFFLILWMNPVWALQALVSTTTSSEAQLLASQA